MKREMAVPRERRRSWYYRLSFPKKTALWGVIFLLPWLLGFFLLFLTPMIEMVAYSFNDIKIVPLGGVSRAPVGWENYRQALLVDATFVPQLVSTLTETLLSSVLNAGCLRRWKRQRKLLHAREKRRCSSPWEAVRWASPRWRTR